MEKYAGRRKTRANIDFLLRIGKEEHMHVNMAFEDVTWYSEGLCNWSTLEGRGSVCHPGNLSVFFLKDTSSLPPPAFASANINLEIFNFESN